MRELDWKIHTLMGNDLTGSGWEWLDEDSNTAILRLYDLSGERIGTELLSIPHYSTTWEGAGLVMKRLREDQSLRVIVFDNYEGSTVFIKECTKLWSDPWETIGHAVEDDFPLALCKAYISAMEERK